MRSLFPAKNKLGIATGSVHHELLMLADFMESVSNASIGFGHGISYISRGARVTRGVSPAMTTEAYANYTALMGGQNSKVWRRVLTNMAPETLKHFDMITEALG